MVDGSRELEDRSWKLEDGRRKSGVGRWDTEDGSWKIEASKLTLYQGTRG